MDKLYAAFDTDKSGFVSFTELLTAISLSGNSDPAVKLSLIFNLYDKDRSNQLERKEILCFLKDVDSESKLQNIDIDSILGSNKETLTKEEFIGLIMSRPDLKKFYLDLIKIFDE